MAVLFTGESPAPNAGSPASFWSTDELKWTKEGGENDLPQSDGDALVRGQVEVARVLQHQFRPAEIHQQWKPHCREAETR